MPYYIHLLDPVQNAGHFMVNKEDALEISKKMKAELPGYLMPKFMQEIPDKNSKTQLF